VVDIPDGHGVENKELRGRRCRRPDRMNLQAEITGVGEVERGAEEEDEHAGDGGGGVVGVGDVFPTGRSLNTSENEGGGAGTAPGAVEDGQPDGDGDA